MILSLRRYWPTYAVSFCGASGLAWIWLLVKPLKDNASASDVIFAPVLFFPWQFMLMNDVLGPWPTYILAFCMASLVSVCMYDLNKRSLKLAILALAAYAGLCIWLYFHAFDIMLVGTTLRRICGPCTAI